MAKFIATKESCTDDPNFTPLFSSLEDFSRGSETNMQRYRDIVQAFSDTYGHAPQFIARAPGRVNLIGEHVDYCGYGVLPMALEQDIAMAVSVSDSSTLTLANMDQQYEKREVSSSTYEIKGHAWYNYFLCGYKGVLEQFKITNPRGMRIMVGGNIPPSAGLSSSSALVCCSSLVTLCANGVPMPSKKDIADICAASERFIGTQGGGMDQAISFLAEPGKALKIDFNPLHCDVVELPSGHAFVVANSLVRANKAAFSGFNERVVECQLATKIIVQANGGNWRSVFKLAEAQKLLKKKLEDMGTIVNKCLHEDPYTHGEICRILEIPDGKLVEEVLSHMSPQAQEAAKRMTSFKLFQRASHVFNEAYRVEQFKKTTEDGNDSSVIAVRLGSLMNGSHSSCSELYECSCPQLDKLVLSCQSGGAYGSRLTGAGWGGCTVSLVPEDKLEAFLDAVCGTYYKERREEMGSSLFSTKPGPGAAVCVLN